MKKHRILKVFLSCILIVVLLIAGRLVYIRMIYGDLLDAVDEMMKTEDWSNPSGAHQGEIPILKSEKQLLAQLQVKEEKYFELSDGTWVSLWSDGETDARYYKLSNGVILLLEEASDQVENTVYYHSDDKKLDGYAEWNETTQKAVSDWLAQMPLLYDIGEQLQFAYESYLSHTEKRYEDIHVEQNVSLIASDEKELQFEITAERTIKHESVTYLQKQTVVFDRETGVCLKNVVESP